MADSRRVGPGLAGVQDVAESGPRSSWVVWFTGDGRAAGPVAAPAEVELIAVVRERDGRAVAAAFPDQARVITLPDGATEADLRREGAAAAKGDIVRFFPATDAVDPGHSRTLSVVIPVSNGERTLSRVFEALSRSDLPRSQWELLVVDDCSADATATLAAEWADVIVRLGPRPHGPAYARNRGAEVAVGECVTFLDADICVQPTTLRQLADYFEANPDVAAVYGTHDGDTAGFGLISRYRDIMTLFRHERSAGETDRFWADCGAVRRRAFAAIGGYNEWHFVRPQVEALDLGHRLRSHGYRIVLQPEIRVAHLKRWTLGGWLIAEIGDQAIPANRLWGSGRGNARRGSWWRNDRVAALMAWTTVVAAGIRLLAGWSWAGPAAAGTAAVLVLTDWPVYAYLARRGGILLAIQSLPLHFIHHLAGGAGSILGSLLRHSIGEPQPSPSVQALSEVGVEKWPPVPRRAEPAPVRQADSTRPPQ